MEPPPSDLVYIEREEEAEQVSESLDAPGEDYPLNSVARGDPELFDEDDPFCFNEIGLDSEVLFKSSKQV